MKRSMKKSILAAVLFGGLFLMNYACAEGKKESAEPAVQESETAVHDHSDDMASAVYQCPMKCEDEKTYPELGTCPTCEMDLKEVKTATEE